MRHNKTQDTTNTKRALCVSTCETAWRLEKEKRERERERERE